ncbi:MAG: GGDEF domain-containing protein [Desulfuromonadales bacterium]|nr:GGDEF domain-containing protein [Desulfuromonadales bacterium]
MTLTAYILMFCGGVIIGLVLYPLVRLIDLDEINRLLNELVRIAALPFTCLFRKKSNPPLRETVTPNIDPREQQISDSAQTIRNILLSVAKTIQRTDKAASDSSLALDSVKGSFDNLDLTDAHQILMREIDRVIDSNTNLKGELASSQEVLAEQRLQIENLRTAVRIDGLTQLANRAYFDEKLTESLDILKRYNQAFSLMMIDLDNFKDINDTYGHPAGDRILKGVAFKIRESLRSSDFLARFGGDEFSLILIKADAHIASDVAWKLCNSLRESRFLLDDIPVTATLSIGVAEADVRDTEESLLKRADEALYRVKQTGRNNVLLADKPVVSSTAITPQAARQKP